VRHKLTVGPEGEIAVPPREAESLGLAGGGPVELVPARGACALLVPARDDSPKAFFAGTLSALTVAEVLQFVFSSLKTGVLLLSFRGDAAGDPTRLRRRSLYFRDGQVVFASSSDPRDRLGPILVDQGLITQPDLERASRLVKSGRPLGQVLVDEGILSPAQLYQGVSAQVREIFLSSFVETDGEFAFLEGPTDESSQVKLAERTRDLLLQGLKRLEQSEQRRGEEEAREAAEAEVAIEVGAPEPAPASRGGGPFETYRRILKHVRTAMAPHLPDAVERINGWFDRQPDAKRPLFKDVSMSPVGDVDTARVLDNVLALGTYQGPAARARALEALEELLSFVLFEAKNRMPRPDAEQLLRVVGRMQVGKA
jgi:hypothetical protein